MSTYTPEQKQEAVRTYITEGAQAAADLIGCDRRSIYRWLGRHVTEATDKRGEQARLRHAEKRAALDELLLDTAADMLHRMNEPVTVTSLDGRTIGTRLPDARECKDLMIAAATALDKYRLEMGEHTDRTVQISMGAVEVAIAELEKQMT